MQLNLRQRLGLVALMCATLILIPATQLGLRFLQERQAVADEQAALPANQGWQGLLNQLARHRSAAAIAAQKPEAAQQRDQAAKAIADQGPALLQALADAGTPPARQQAAAQWLKDFAALAAQLRQANLQLPDLMAAHQRLSERLLAEAAQLNADAGLLLDAQPATHFAIVAGLQLAPRLTDTLSELSTLAEAAAVDDVAALASAATRYRSDSSALAQQLDMAERLDPERAAGYRRTHDALLQQRSTVLEALEASAKDVNYPLDKLAAAFQRAAQLQTQFSQQASQAVHQRLAERAADVRRHALFTLLGLALGLGLVGLALWRTARGIVVPVQQAISVTERIAEGDLSVQIPLQGGDDIGRVLQAIATMQGRLKELVLKLQQASGEIHVAADEIAAGNHDLSQRSESAASRLQEATGSVELLSSTVATTARAALQASQLAQSAWTAAGDGRGVVEQFLQTMQSIDASARRMADIVTVIDGIAFQTNILALNAAVEAARAGEQGRGFAVVAAEVRSLAQRSASAAREVKGLIHESVTRVERGSGQVSQASLSMHAVAERIGQVKALIEGIAHEAQGESARMDELSRSVGEIDQMSQQNAALVEQAAAAATSLNQQAEQMASLAGSFRLQAA